MVQKTSQQPYIHVPLGTCVKVKGTHLEVLAIDKQEHCLGGVAHDQSSLVLAGEKPHQLFIIVLVMEFKLGLQNTAEYM